MYNDKDYILPVGPYLSGTDCLVLRIYVSIGIPYNIYIAKFYINRRLYSEPNVLLLRIGV